MIWTGCILIRRALISELNLTFNIQLKNSEDDDFWYRICLGRSLTFWKHVTTGYRIREVSASSEPLKKHLGVLYFRRLLMAEPIFAKYSTQIQRKYRRDFEKFAIYCAQVKAIKSFLAELSNFRKHYLQDDKGGVVCKELCKFIARVIKYLLLNR